MAFSWLRRRFGSKAARAARPLADGAAAAAAPLQLAPAALRLLIDDGLVLAVGPSGDPIPPDLLQELADVAPMAAISLPDGRSVSMARAAAVLTAQKTGRLAPSGADAWLLAMLGAGPQVEDVPPTPDAAGTELLVTLPTGEALRLFDAKPDALSEHGACLWSPALGGCLSIEVLAEQLQQALGAQPLTAPEVDLPDGLISLDQQSIVLTLPPLGPLRLLDAGATLAGGPPIGLQLAAGRPINLQDLVAKCQAVAMADQVAAHASAQAVDLAASAPAPTATLLPLRAGASTASPGPAAPSWGNAASASASGEQPPTATTTPTAQAVAAAPLPAQRARLLDLLEPDLVADAMLVIVAGLPPGAQLTAATDNGDDTWAIARAILAEVELVWPAGPIGEISFEVAAIGLAGASGELERKSHLITVPAPGSPIA